MERQKYYLFHYHNPPDAKKIERVEKVSIKNEPRKKTILGYIAYTQYKDFINDIELIIFENNEEDMQEFLNDLYNLNIGIRCFEDLEKGLLLEG